MHVQEDRWPWNDRRLLDVHPTCYMTDSSLSVGTGAARRGKAVVTLAKTGTSISGDRYSDLQNSVNAVAYLVKVVRIQ